MYLLRLLGGVALQLLPLPEFVDYKFVQHGAAGVGRRARPAPAAAAAARARRRAHSADEHAVVRCGGVEKQLHRALQPDAQLPAPPLRDRGIVLGLERVRDAVGERQR